MATGTSTLATARAPVKEQHTGTMTVHIGYVGSANTLSDIIYLAKLPQRALVTMVDGIFGSGSNVDSVIKLGWDAPNAGNGSATAFGTHTSSTTDAVTIFDMNLEEISPVLISFTDSIGQAFARLFLTCSAGSFTDTWSIDLTVQYTMDHGEGIN